jgi:hypothetical protein
VDDDQQCSFGYARTRCQSDRQPERLLQHDAAVGQRQQQMIIQQQRQQIQHMQQQLEVGKQQLQVRLQEHEEENKKPERSRQTATANCCVCMDAAPSVLYLPCKHVKVCEGCDDQLAKRDICPVCRTSIEGRITQLHL